MMASRNLPNQPALPKWVRLQRRALTARERIDHSYVIGAPADAARVLGPMVVREEVEVVWVLCLNAQHRVLSITELTRGLVNASLLHPREVFRIAIAMNAVGVIIAHNHPSGNARPSAEDRLVTQQLVEAGRLLDLPLFDHVICTEHGGYFSFAEAGLL